jgi:hypothetical protein
MHANKQNLFITETLDPPLAWASCICARNAANNWKGRWLQQTTPRVPENYGNCKCWQSLWHVEKPVANFKTWAVHE